MQSKSIHLFLKNTKYDPQNTNYAQNCVPWINAKLHATELITQF